MSDLFNIAGMCINISISGYLRKLSRFSLSGIYAQMNHTYEPYNATSVFGIFIVPLWK